jgi:hypothetical protein
MKKPNPILILCNDSRSGGEFYTKNLSSLNAGKTSDDADWVWVYNVRSVVTLDAILSSESGTDFDGYILPDFKDNPERFSIIDAIKSHKLCIRSDLAKDFHLKTFKHRKSLKLTVEDREQLQEEAEREELHHFFKQMAQP